jgi:hypothetical protein
MNEDLRPWIYAFVGVCALWVIALGIVASIFWLAGIL